MVSVLKRKKRKPHSLTQFIDRLLIETIQVTEQGQRRRITKFEAIIRSLLAKEVKGDDQAARVRLKYEQYAARGARRETRLTFVDNAYTQAVASYSSRKDTDHG